MDKIIAVCALLMSTLASHTSFTSSRAQNRSAEKPEETITVFGGTGSDLLELCSAPTIKAGDTVLPTVLVKGARDNGQCAGYITGVNDGVMGQLAAAPNAKLPYCLPPGVNSKQSAMVVKKYLEDNPAQLHLPASLLTIHALVDSFPCR